MLLSEVDINNVIIKLLYENLDIVPLVVALAGGGRIKVSAISREQRNEKCNSRYKRKLRLTNNRFVHHH